METNIKTNMKQTEIDKMIMEIREACITIWMSYDDTHGYATEKAQRVGELRNENVMFTINMFDPYNQRRLFDILKPDTQKYFITITNEFNWQ